MSRSPLVLLVFLTAAALPPAPQDTARATKKGPELSEPVTLGFQVAVPRCTGYWLRLVNRTDHPLQVSIGKVVLGTAPPDQRPWTFRIPSELGDVLTVRGVTFRSVAGPPPPEHLLWDQFRVYCGR